MLSAQKAFVILTPAFSIAPGDQWLPFQGSFIRALNRLHPELHVVVLAFHYPALPEKRSTWEGNEIIAFGAGMSGGLRSLRLWARVWGALGCIRRRYEIAGMLSMFCSESAFVGHYYAASHRLKHKIWLLGQDARRENVQVARIRPRAGELIAISDFLVREFRQSHGTTPAHLIPIGIAPEDFPARSGKRTIHLIGAGTLSPIKQYDIFIDLVETLCASIPDLRALICGGGSEEGVLRQRIAAKGLETNIEIRTGLGRTQVLALMQQSRILLHTSAYEGFGMVCTEALYAGAQVISFVKPMDEAIPGWHIAGSREEMAATALRLLRQDEPPGVPPLPFSMADTARKMMQVFNYGAS